MITLSGVNKSYGKKQVLFDVNLEIPTGSFTMLRGVSGSGKSTLMSIIGGIETATSGTVTIDGQDVGKLKGKARTEFYRHKVGFVFQFYNLISNLNALENVEFAASVTADHLDPADTLDKVGLSERAKNFPSQLSGGEQQRVAIARAVAKNPLLLLCDEPTGALDYKTGKMVLKLLEDVNVKYNKTVVLITHNSAIAPMADKVIRMRSGKVENIEVNSARVPVETIEW